MGGITSQLVSSSKPRIIGFYGSWAAYRDGDGRCRVEDIDASLCTHYIWCFLAIKNGEVAFGESGDRENLRKFVRHIRSNNSEAKILASVGGWTYSRDSAFADAAASSSSRQRFVDSANRFMNSYDLDGIDIDWEYPDESNREDFVELMRILMMSSVGWGVFDSGTGKTITISVSGSTSRADRAYDVSGLSTNCHYINLMSYALRGDYDGRTGHHAPFEGSGQNLKDTVRYWIRNGSCKWKLNVGIPMYGHTWQLENPSNNSVGSRSIGPGDSGRYTDCRGTLAYHEILENFQSESWHKKFDSSARARYAYRGDQWISYDDPQTVREKAQWIKDENYGGAMFWSLELDDFKGRFGERYPILKAAKRILH